MKIAIIEPHYDDAWINLGGYILKNPDIEFLILSLCDDPSNAKNETKHLEAILPNVKTAALHFKGIPWEMRDRIHTDAVKSYFLKINKRSLFNRKGVRSFAEVESRLEQQVTGYNRILLPYGAKHPQHIVTSLLHLKGDVKYYLEFPYPYGDEFWEIMNDLPQTVYDITNVLQRKIEIFKDVFVSQKAMLQTKSHWGCMKEVNREIIFENSMLNDYDPVANLV